MTLRDLRFFLLGLAPITLAACIDTELATAPPASTAPAIGIDLGNSSRIPHIAGFAGEGEDHGRTAPVMTREQHGSMAAMGHESGMQMDRGSIAMSHGSMEGMPMDEGSMVGMDRGAMSDMPTDHGVMAGMEHGSQARTVSDHGSMPGMHDTGAKTQMAHSGPGHSHAQGTGAVNSVDAAGHKLNVSHGPIPTIGWPAMTMDFAVAPSVDLHGVRPGTRINFTIEQGDDGMYVIQSITPAGGVR